MGKRFCKLKTKVVKLCWSCGSVKETIEEVDTKLVLPSIEEWNLCLECQNRLTFSDPKVN